MALFSRSTEGERLMETNYDLVLKGGQVIDPANGIDAILDVAVNDGGSPPSGRIWMRHMLRRLSMPRA